MVRENASEDHPNRVRLRSRLSWKKFASKRSNSNDLTSKKDSVPKTSTRGPWTLVKRLTKPRPHLAEGHVDGRDGGITARIVYGVELSATTTVLVCFALLIVYLIIRELGALLRDVGLTARHCTTWQFWTILVTGKSNPVVAALRSLSQQAWRFLWSVGS